MSPNDKKLARFVSDFPGLEARDGTANDRPQRFHSSGLEKFSTFGQQALEKGTIIFAHGCSHKSAKLAKVPKSLSNGAIVEPPQLRVFQRSLVGTRLPCHKDLLQAG